MQRSKWGDPYWLRVGDPAKARRLRWSFPWWKPNNPPRMPLRGQGVGRSRLPEKLVLLYGIQPVLTKLITWRSLGVQHLRDHVAMDIGKSEVAALESIGQALMVDAELMKNRGL